MPLRVASEAGQPEGELVRVDGVEGAVVEDGLEVDDRVAGHGALLGHGAHALLDAGEELPGHDAAHDLGLELDAGAGVG